MRRLSRMSPGKIVTIHGIKEDITLTRRIGGYLCISQGESCIELDEQMLCKLFSELRELIV